MSSTPIGLIFDLAGSPGPTFVPWGETNYALFGPNGAGKTRRLDAIRHLFHGGAPHSPTSSTYLEGRSTCSVIIDATTGIEDIVFLFDRMLQQELGLDHGSSQRAKHFWRDGGRVELASIGPTFKYGDAHRDAVLFQQRLVEVSRDSLHDQLVVRPCYLDSSEHPEISTYLNCISDELTRSSKHDFSWEFTDLGVEQLITPDGDSLTFGTIHTGNWFAPHTSIEMLTDFNCVDLRPDSDPEMHWTGWQLAELLKQGADLNAWADEVSQRATRHFRSALHTTTGLHLHVPTHAQLLSGDRVRWLGTTPAAANVLDGAATISLDRLSAAERTWANLAILRAAPRPSDAIILLVDEPEQGLHRAAERDALTWLADFGEDPGLWLWCATHSPVLLNDDRVEAIAVRTDLHFEDSAINYVSTMKRLGSTERQELESLGLGPTDLLTLHHGFLLVEGEHDDIVLTELIGTELSKLRVEVLPIRGGSKLPGAIEARTLFDFTDALVFALLDAIPMDGLHEVWGKAKKHADDPERALAVLSDGFSWPRGDESTWMKEWLMRSIKRGRGRHSRVEPLGVAAADIIEYLPVQHFVPAAQSWEELRAQHKSALESTKGIPKDFKKWLTAKHRADFEPDSLREACQRVDETPGDFTQLLVSIETALTEYDNQRPV